MPRPADRKGEAAQPSPARGLKVSPNPTSSTAAIVGDDRDRRRAETVRRLAVVELVELLHGPAARLDATPAGARTRFAPDGYVEWAVAW